MKNRIEPNYDDIESALIEGYNSRRRPTDEAGDLIKLFLVLRNGTYIGWAASREEMRFKVQRYADETLKLAGEVL